MNYFDNCSNITELKSEFSSIDFGSNVEFIKYINDQYHKKLNELEPQYEEDVHEEIISTEIDNIIVDEKAIKMPSKKILIQCMITLLLFGIGIGIGFMLKTNTYAKVTKTMSVATTIPIPKTPVPTIDARSHKNYATELILKDDIITFIYDVSNASLIERNKMSFDVAIKEKKGVKKYIVEAYDDNSKYLKCIKTDTCYEVSFGTTKMLKIKVLPISSVQAAAAAIINSNISIPSKAPTVTPRPQLSAITTIDVELAREETINRIKN